MQLPGSILRWLQGRGANGDRKRSRVPRISRRRSQRVAVPPGRLLIYGHSLWQIVDASLTGLRVKVGNQTALPEVALPLVIKWGDATLAVEAKIVWRDGEVAGFMFTDTSGYILLQMSRLLEPLVLGSALALVDSEATLGFEAGKRWFHGPQDSNLWVWVGPHSQRLQKWMLHTGPRLFTWSEEQGLELRLFLPLHPGAPVPQEPLPQPVGEHLPWLRDVLWSVAHPVREDLLETASTRPMPRYKH